MNTLAKDVPPTHARHIPWLPLVFAILTIITYFMVNAEMQGGSVIYTQRGVSVSNEAVPQPVTAPTSYAEPQAPVTTHASPSGATSQTSQSAEVPADLGGYYPRYPIPPTYGGQPSVTDTREFLKTDYSATMRTRNVQDLTRRIETTVRGYGGRVDQESSSPQYGSVSFVVPLDKFDEFRTELEGLVNWRFLTVSVSSQNLLPQKQSIEQQQTQASSTMADLTASRKQLVATHTNTVRSLQAQITADAQSLASLGAEPSTDPTLHAQILAEMQSVSADESSLQARLQNENASYTANLQGIDSSIKYAQENIDAIQTQDQNLTDNVATVNGTVSVNWITLWQTALLYLPGYTIPMIFAVLTILSYLWDRRRYGPSVLGF